MQKYQDEEIVIGQRIKPQTREQRRIQQDKDFLEKQRVMDRQENFERHVEAQFNNDELYNEHHRFGDNFEQMERQEKLARQQQKQEYYQQLREQAQARDRMYQERMEQEDQRRREAIQARGNTKNKSGESFNILTREYLNKEDQEREAKKMEAYRVAAQARMDNLVSRNGGGVNLLTGEPFSWARK